MAKLRTSITKRDAYTYKRTQRKKKKEKKKKENKRKERWKEIKITIRRSRKTERLAGLPSCGLALKTGVFFHLNLKVTK